MIKVFISDLHLEENRPDISQLFLNFLSACTGHVDSLYILGDFFEVWIGDDNMTPFNLTILHALKKATQQHLKIFFIHGNRDFLIGKRFLRASGCKLLADESVIDLFGQPALLMHGDTLCTADEKYLRFRKKSRNWFLQKLFLLKSLEKRQAIAMNYRAKSKQHTSTMPDDIMDVTQAEVARVMQKHHVHSLIHGHTHRPGVNPFSLEDTLFTRTVLGAWHDNGSALICRGQDDQQLVTFAAASDISFSDK